MSKNSVDSVINIIDRSFRRIEGTLVSANATTIVWKYKRSGGQRIMQEGFLREDVAAFGDDFIVVKVHGPISSKIFRPARGHVTTDKDGWFAAEGVTYNPRYANVLADLGTGGDGGAKPAAKKKTTKKAK